MADSLDSIRRAIADLSDDDGEFYVACAETDDCPAPLTGRRFPTEAAASEAAALCREYRDRLRESDPDLPERRLTVYELSGDALTLVSTRERTGRQRVAEKVTAFESFADRVAAVDADGGGRGVGSRGIGGRGTGATASGSQ